MDFHNPKFILKYGYSVLQLWENILFGWKDHYNNFRSSKRLSVAFGALENASDIRDWHVTVGVGGNVLTKLLAH